MIDLNDTGSSIAFNLTSQCNSLCKYCVSKATMERLKGVEIEPNKFRSLIKDEIADNKTIVLSGGEPTVYLAKHQLYDIFDADKAFFLQTNGVLIEDGLLSALDTCCSWRVKVSIGGLGDVYNDITQTKNYETVIENIRQLSLIKDDNGLLTLNFVLGKYNVHQLDELYEVAKELDVHVLTLSTLSQGSLSGQDLSLDEKNAAKDSLMSFGEKNNMRVQNITPAASYIPPNKKYNSVVGFIGYQLDENNICRSAYNITIRQDGTFGSCCRGSYNPEFAFPFTIYDKTWEEILFSDERRRAIENFSKMKSCQYCINVLSKQEAKSSTCTIEKPTCIDVPTDDSCIAFAKKDEKTKTQVYPAPKFFSFLTNTDCNLNCVYCSAMGWRESMNTQIPPEKLVETLNDIVKLEGNKTTYFSGGEPTDYLDRHKIHDDVFCNNTYKILQTNGTSFSDDLIETLDKSSKWRVCVTIGGMNSLYEYAHNAPEYPFVIENLQKLLEVRDEQSIVSFNFLMMNSNLHQIDEFVDISCDLGIDHIMLTKLFHIERGHDFCSKECVTDLSSCNIDELEKKLLDNNMAASLFPFGKNISNKKISSLRELFCYRDKIDDLDKCISLYDLVFWPDGTISQCCRCHQEEDIFSINLFDSDLHTVINSPERIGLIENFRERNSCQRCLGLT